MLKSGQTFTRTLPNLTGLLAEPLTQTLTVIEYKPTGVFAQYAVNNPYIVSIDGSASIRMSEKEIENWANMITEE